MNLSYEAGERNRQIFGRTGYRKKVAGITHTMRGI
jgi:hypothetical protein